MKLTELFSAGRKRSELALFPYVIAEAGVNHEGDLNVAFRLIDEAAEAGADAIKFQTYKANTLASKYSPAYWDITKETTESQHKLFQKYDRFWEKEFRLLKLRCDEVGIEFLSTPFDLEAAHFLDELMDVFKISSSDITNKPFIEAISAYGKPIILSTGASNHTEIREALQWIDSECEGVPVALLHCVLNYPTEDNNANLGMIQDLQGCYPDSLIGYSDHTLPRDMKNLEIAALLGASIIEKHFTYDKSLPGNDHYHAMDKEDLRNFRRNMVRIQEAFGETEKRSLPTEQIARDNARRSLVAACRIPCGSTIELDQLLWKRPGYGISPKEIDNVIGRPEQTKPSERKTLCRVVGTKCFETTRTEP